jgi:TonB-linked SusC/RagA family outer membrane protein
MAQERKITGKVTVAEDGSDLPGVSIQLKGTSKGVQTDGTGSFSFNAPENGGTLVFSFVGMLTQEISIGNKTRIDVQLVNDTKQLSEVVVTAFGISKAQKALGYSTERIDATKLQQKSEPDVLRALQNKIPGVNIVGSNGIAGSATKINIRGTNTFFGNSQPLFVVDGIPYDNTETTDGQTRLSDGSGSFSSRSADIDPNNIESMTVLKGGAAAALYGTRASNGVILITTKTGSTKKSQKGLEVSVASSYSIEEVSGLPEFQNKYGTGSQNVAANANGSWGAPFGSIDSLAMWPAYAAAFPNFPKKYAYKAYPNNVKDFFRQGGLFENSISITGGAGDKTTMSAVISNSKQDSYIPNTGFGRFNISVGAITRLDNKLTMSGNLSYNNTSQFGPILGGDNAASLFGRTMYLGRSWPLQEYPDTNPATNASVFFVGSGSSDNPNWSIKNNTYKSNVDRLAGSVNFNYAIAPWLTANYKAGINTYTDTRKTTIRPGSAGAGSLGSITLDNIRFQEIESNFFLTGNKKVGADFDLTLTTGYNYNQRTTDRNSTIGNQILFFGIDNYNLTNVQNKNPNIVTPFIRRRIYGVYGDMTVGYRNSLFLNVTARNDWSSTLPATNRSFLYPSASLSWNFTDDIPFFRKSDFLSAGKLRMSISKVGRDADPYSLFSVYNINPDLVLPNSQTGTSFPFRNVPGASLEETTYDPNLKPEFTNEMEIGTELWFLNKRIGLDLTLYNRKSTNLIAPIAIPNATGFSQNYTNLGQITNKGIELGFTLIPLSLTNGLKWELYTTFTKNISNIDELLPGVEGDDNEIILQNTYAGSIQAVFRKGQPYGMLKGVKAARDDQGNLLINPNTGLLIDDPTPQLLGNPAPNFIMGINNTITYKGFSLGAVISYTDGGVLYSSTTSFQLGRGVTRDTENRDHPIVVPGVLGDPNTFKPLLGGDGKTIPNTIQVMANDIYFQSGQGSFATNSADEMGVWDATTIRLREINFGYSLPKKILSKTPFGSASISLTGRNLWYKAVNFPKYSNFDPEINTYGASNASGIEFSSAPSTRRYGASIRFTF